MSSSDLKQTAEELTDLIPSQEDGEHFALFLTKFKSFLSQLEQEDKDVGQEVLSQIGQTRDAPIYQDVGKILRTFHDQLTHFKDDLPASLAKLGAAGVSDNLEHILSLTDKAANKTMDIAEALADRMANEYPLYSKISADIQSVIADNNLTPESKAKLEQVLTQVTELDESSKKSQADTTDILVAQDYQDLTGQLIQKVLGIIRDLETDLSGLIVHYGKQLHAEKAADATPLEGPLKSTDENRNDQDDVNSLLSQFGF